MHRTFLQITTAAQNVHPRAPCRTPRSSRRLPNRNHSSHPNITPQTLSTPSHRSTHKPKPTKSPLPFIDRINIRARAGSGGAGCISFHRIGSYKKRPSGGHGGKGGSVYLVTDPGLGTLKMEKHHFNAYDGKRGGKNGMAGRDGRDVFVRVPVGVVVRRVLDWDEADLFEDEDEEVKEEEEEEGNDDMEVFDEDIDNGNEMNPFESADDMINEMEVMEDDLGDDAFDDSTDESTSDSNDIDDEFEDFDTYYQNLQASRRKRGRARRKDGLPMDYDDVVNQGMRAEDGMYHWAPDNEMATTAYPNQPNERRKSIFVADLDQPNTSLLIAKGGKQGVGNQAYANRQYSSNLLSHAVKKSRPEMGEITHLELELKLIADIGLVGFPNAGKSSLLSAMSRARPKIASYPFTTLHPLVGTIHYKDDFKIVMADVPGLIDGAAEGRGRGVEFLRHIERTKALVYIVDAASVDGRDPINDLRILGKELREYGSSGYFDENEVQILDDVHESFEEEMKRRRREIMNRPSLILANKMDLVPNHDAGLGRREELLFQLAKTAEEVGIVCEKENILGVSAGVTGEGLQVLSKRLRTVLGA